MPYTNSDVAIWAAHTAVARLEWAVDSLSGNGFDTEALEFDVIDEVVEALKASKNLNQHYSDGRPVATSVLIESGHSYCHVWSYRGLSTGEQLLMSGDRTADPGQDRGTFRIFANESTCALRVELLEPEARPRLIKGGAA